MARRIPTRLILLLSAALIVAGPAAAEPRPGTVVGLDLGSPHDAAVSFARAWSAGDYFVAYLALDPELRLRFMDAVFRFDFREILGQSPAPEFFDSLPAMTAESRFPGAAPGIPADLFAEFDGFMRAARHLGIPLPAFDAAAMGEMKPLPDSGRAGLARVPVASAGGGGTLVLRQSAEGRWRLLGIEKRDLPEFWAYRPE